MTYSIRQAKIPHDTTTLDKIEMRAFEYSKAWLYDKAYEGTAWWLAEYDGRAVGMAGIRYPIAEAEGAAWLCRAAVIKTHRGNGIQKRLLRAREAYARKQGATEIWTYTSTDNSASSNSLISAGFRLWVPTRWEIPGDKWSAWVYWRKYI